VQAVEAKKRVQVALNNSKSQPEVVAEARQTAQLALFEASQKCLLLAISSHSLTIFNIRSLKTDCAKAAGH